MRALITDERGIAMTEAVITIPFFILIWMSLITLHRLYDARLEAQIVSMATALDHSYRGCRGNPSPVGDVTGRGGDISSETNTWLSTIAGEQPLGWTHTKGEYHRLVDGIPMIFGGPELEVRASQKVICNMRPKDGIVDLVLGLVKGLIGLD